MDISKIGAAIENLGYKSAGLDGVSKDQDAQKFAQENGISVNEAKSILKEAEQKAAEQENNPFQSAMLEYLNQPEEEDEIVIIDDADFDNFLNENTSEEKIQEMLQKQGLFKQDQNQDQAQSQNGDNPFKKLFQ